MTTHFVVIKDGEKVRSCNSITQAKAISRHIKGSVVRTNGNEIQIPATKWRKFRTDVYIKPKYVI